MPPGEMFLPFLGAKKKQSRVCGTVVKRTFQTPSIISTSKGHFVSEVETFSQAE
jgi:hypothetical protein